CARGPRRRRPRALHLPAGYRPAATGDRPRRGSLTAGAAGMPKPRILVIDDDAGIREQMKMTLGYDGYDVSGAATGQEGLALAERETPDLVLLDVKMPGMDGLDVLTRLH